MFPPAASIRDSGGMRLPASVRDCLYNEGESDAAVYSISLQRHPHWWGVPNKMGLSSNNQKYNA